MLLAQMVCPGLVMGCVCRQAVASCCTGSEQSACCCAETLGQDSLECPHCGASSHNPQKDGDAGWHRAAVCHCGDQIPFEPSLLQTPESSEVIILLSWLTQGTVCEIDTPVLPFTPARAQVPSSDALVPNHSQRVYCVWVI